MSVMHFDPFRQIDRLTNELLSGTRMPLGMPMDVWQADDGYHVALDLPGVDPASVEITHERSVLTVRAERRPEYEQGQALVAERPQGRFTRQLQLGDGLDPQGVRATYADGVLHLTLPVAQSAQPRRIEVQAAGGRRETALEAGQQPGATVGQQRTGSSEQAGEREPATVG